MIRTKFDRQQLNIYLQVLISLNEDTDNNLRSKLVLTISVCKITSSTICSVNEVKKEDFLYKIFTFAMISNFRKLLVGFIIDRVADFYNFLSGLTTDSPLLISCANFPRSAFQQIVFQANKV